MNFFRRAALRMALKGADLSLTDPAGWTFLTGGATWAKVPVNSDTQWKIPAAYSAIRLIAETVSTLPLHLYKTTPKGREKAKNHSLYDLVHSQPNPYMTAVEWKESMAVSLATMGQAYNYVDRFESTGRITSIQPLAKSRIKPELKADGSLVYWYTARNGAQIAKTRNDVCPIRGFGNIGDLEGYAPHQLHANSLALSVAVEKYGAEFFGSGGRPTGVLTTDDEFKAENRDAIRENFQKYTKESWIKGMLPILERGLKYQAVATPNNDAQFLETRKHQIAEVARIYRVPLHMLMEMDSAGKSNTEQSGKHFLDYTLMPYVVRIEQALNSCLLTAQERSWGMFFEFDVRGLLRGDSASRATYYLGMRQAAAITANEIRDLENMPRIDGADELFVPLNMAPLDLVREIQKPKD